MTMARVACPSCHQQKEVSPTGTILWKASTQMCAQCHDQMAVEQFQSLQETLKVSLSDIESTVSRLREARDTANLDADRTATLTLQLEKLQDDLNFLRVGNGIHNIHYANTLTRSLVKQLSALCRELEIDEPKVALPEIVKILELSE